MLTEVEKRDVHAALVEILGKDRAADFFLEGIASAAFEHRGSRRVGPPVGSPPASVRAGAEGGAA